MLVDDVRPTTFKEMAGDAPKEVQRQIEKEGDVPNMFFYGPYGTGKTTTARIVASRLTDGNYIELNASKDRGIDVVRGRISNAARTQPLSGGTQVIILDEMDNMTTESQRALKSTMEGSPAVFILACNDKESVDGGVLSRCMQFEFSRLKDWEMDDYLAYISREYELDVTYDELHSITESVDGDLRSGLNMLEKRLMQFQRV